MIEIIIQKDGRQEATIERATRFDLLEGPPGRFDCHQILLALILFALAVEEAVSVPDAFQGAVAEREIEFVDEAA